MSGKKEPDPLAGVTVDGVPVAEWIEKKEGSKKTREIEVERRAAEKIKHGKHRPYMPKPKAGGPRVARRVIRLTNRQIRKEYGVMAKPFSTNVENVLWVIINKGPVSMSDVVGELEWKGKVSSLSALLSGIWNALGDEKPHAAHIIKRFREAGAYRYQLEEGVDISVEMAAQKYRLAINAQRNFYKEELAAGKNDTPPEEEERPTDEAPPEEEPVPEEPPVSDGPLASDPPPAVSPVADLLSAVERVFGLQITVGGRVEVVFHFKVGG